MADRGFATFVRSFLRPGERRWRLVAFVVGSLIISGLVVVLRPAPARVASVLVGQAVREAFADAGVVRTDDDGRRHCDTLAAPTVEPGPCGRSLDAAVAGLCAWEGKDERRAARVSCAGSGPTFVAALTLPPAEAGGERGGFSRSFAPPDGASLLPPLIAILFAIVFRHVLVALGVAVWFGACLAARSDPFTGLWSAVADYAVPSVSGNWLMFVFTLSLMGMVNVLIRGGGVQGLVDVFSRRARGTRSTQLVTAAMGTAIFFDDYANSVVVGASARPLTDARRISREKLAYLVDSTAAPIAGIALVSTWIAIELQLLGQQISYVPEVASAYDLFLRIVPYRFYCLFTIAFVYLVVLLQRDFGPMLRAERRARETGAVLRPGAVPLAGGELTQARPEPGVPLRWWNAVIPIAATLVAAMGGFLVAGYGPMAAAGRPFALLSPTSWLDAFVYGGDYSPQVLAISGGVGTAVAILLVVVQGILTPGKAVLAWLRGVWAMRLALGILVLAISIRAVTDALQTAPFLVSLLHDVPAVWLPLLSFVVAAGVAFATGTSWGTMGILLPVVVPLVHHQLLGDPGAAAGPVLLLAVASVLDGAIFGDHCSPISDTTVLSSLACASDHMDHVRTQAPYALVTMAVAGLVGYVFVAWTGASWFLVFPTGVALLAAVLLVFGRNPARR